MNILDCIGNTPLLSIGNIYFKMEMQNPSGSIKDRIAKEMILPYIGDVHRYFTVVEATSGNTGISVAMVCAALGLNCWLVCPHSTSVLKIKLMRQYGAKIRTENDIASCIERAKRMVKSGQADIYLDQFTNLRNVNAQKKMAEEALIQFQTDLYSNIKPNAIVAGTGTGGTLMGLHHVFPDAEVYEICTAGQKPIEGITDCVRQTLIPRGLKRTRIAIPYDLAKDTANALMKHYGISCGISSGANFYAANMIKHLYSKVLTVFSDGRMRYL